MPISGFALAYVERGRPIRRAADFHIYVEEWTDERNKEALAVLDKSAAAYSASRAILEKTLSGKRPDPKLIKQIYEQRPCRSKAQYDKGMSAAFHYESTPCRHLGACCSKNDKSGYFIKHLTEVSKEMADLILEYHEQDENGA